jgi:glycosyltransferase involved in cell wall biosynthesis
MRDVDLFIAPSRQLRERFLSSGLAPSRIVHCTYGLDQGLRPSDYRRRAFDGPPLECAFLGSVAVHKGIDVLLDAFSGIEGARLTVYGKAAPQYLRRASGDRIRFAGEIGDAEKPRAFNAMDVLVVPSIWLENSPITIQEAFLFGVPAVVSNIGGMAELVQDGWNGMLFKVGDASDLRRKIEYLATNPATLERLAENVPQVKSITDHAVEIEGLYERVFAPRLHG